MTYNMTYNNLVVFGAAELESGDREFIERKRRVQRKPFFFLARQPVCLRHMYNDQDNTTEARPYNSGDREDSMCA